MKIVIPLAGPDFDLPDGRTKAELPFAGSTLLRHILERRPWWRRGQIADRDLVFVLRDTSASVRFADAALRAWYPAAGRVMLSRFARGAALSALAGLALCADAEEVVGIDLVDIDYDSECDPVRRLDGAPDDALALTFPADDPVYSYLQTDGEGRVVRAAEKRVISDIASAGTYFFGSPAAYLAAVAHNLMNRESVMHRDLFFVCPVYNGIVAAGGRVTLETVNNLTDIKQAVPA